MFGTLRFVLALMVMLSHLWSELSVWVGPYAVFGFFVLSGYLMARVLDRSYASDGGTRRFFVNRALRIYPPYLAVLALSALLVLLLPDISRRLHFTLALPRDAMSWVQNLAIFGIHRRLFRVAALIPPAWSIDIELCLYLAIGLVLRRNARLTALATLACAVYTGMLVFQDASFTDRYANVGAGGLPFGVGALLYHARDRISTALAGRVAVHVAVAAALFTANAVFPALVARRSFAYDWGFYLSVVAVAYLVAGLSQLQTRRAAPAWARTDDLLGALSYPVFLCHWQVAVVVVWLGLASERGAELFLWCLPLAPLSAWAVHRVVERPVEALRDRIRGSEARKARRR